MILIGDAVNCTGLVIGHQNRPVYVLLHVNRTAEINAVFIHPAFSEGLRLGGIALAVQKRDHDPRATGFCRVLGSVLGAENCIAVFFSEHLARIEHHAQVV